MLGDVELFLELCVFLALVQPKVQVVVLVQVHAVSDLAEVET